MCSRKLKGVWKATKGEVGQAVKHALKVGYRHIDGAFIYGVSSFPML